MSCKPDDVTGDSRAPAPSIPQLFAGRRGRLLAGLLLAEFGAAVQTIAYATVLPIASQELGGRELFGATLAAGYLTTILVLATGSGTFRWTARTTLFLATAVYVGGVVVAASAVAMVWLLAGSVLRGVASGLLAGFGLTAIGGLFDNSERPRVLALFAGVWLLPSLAGPMFNAIVTVFVGWRWAMAWPAAVVVGARLLIGRDVDVIPWSDERPTLRPGRGVIVVGGLAAASAAPQLGGGWAVVLFGAGVVATATSSWGLVRALTTHHPVGFRMALVLYGLSIAYFGGSGLVTVGVVAGLHQGAVASSVAYGAGLVAWSVVGLRPTTVDARIGDTTTIGLGLMGLALAGEAVVQLAGMPVTAALATAVAAWAVAGAGMGLAYPRISAGAFDDVPASRVSTIAVAVAFAELSGSAAGSLLGGGIYSLGSDFGSIASASIGWAFGVLATVAAATAVLSSRVRTPTTDR